MIAFVPIPHSRPSKSNPWLYNRKSFQPLLTAFFFPLCCNLFARMSNPAYVRLVTRRTVEEIGSHTVLHTYCDNNIPTLLLFRASTREELQLPVPLLDSSINYLTDIIYQYIIYLNFHRYVNFNLSCKPLIPHRAQLKEILNLSHVQLQWSLFTYYDFCARSNALRSLCFLFHLLMHP